MRNKILALAMLVTTLVAVLALSATTRPVQAQGDKPVVCDSTLITLTYLAEHDYAYHSSMDLAKFEKGQFKPLFDAMMTSMQGTPEAMMAATPDAMMAGTQQAMMSGVELKPGVVQGEDASCAGLRADVEAFLYKTLSSKMMTK